ncbi:MAG: response regulator [Pseudomonadota bacterium]
MLRDGAAGRAPDILLIEDEPTLAEVARDYLVAAGMEVTVMGEGTGAAGALLSGRHDLAVLDLMLPGVDGLTICREVRLRSEVPIIMTTARVEEIDRLLGLELGADDYLCKPYSPRELVARVRAVLRRTAARATPDASTPPRLVIDEEGWRAAMDGAVLDLTPREFQILRALVRRPGRVFSRDQLLDLAFPDGADVVDRTVDAHVKNIRRKIASVSDWQPIRSVYGVGYAFDA